MMKNFTPDTNFETGHRQELINIMLKSQDQLEWLLNPAKSNLIISEDDHLTLMAYLEEIAEYLRSLTDINMDISNETEQIAYNIQSAVNDYVEKYNK